MNATAVGLDFSCATAVVFAEVPDTADVLLQAEGRAHRLTSKSAVNVYVLLCKASRDVRTWCRLAESLERQAPLLDTGRKSLPTSDCAEPVSVDPEGQEQGVMPHAYEAGDAAMGAPGACTGVLQGDLGDEVKAARAAAAGEASGRSTRKGADPRGKKALYVDCLLYTSPSPRD